MKKFEVLGFSVEFTRRRYGNMTFTWIHVVLPDGRHLTLGDPYPAVVPSRAHIEQAIRAAQGRGELPQ